MGLVHLLAIVTSALGLPGLIEGLEVEDINAPGERTTDSLLVVLLGILGAGNSRAVVRSTSCCPVSYNSEEISVLSQSLTSGPASFTSSKVNLVLVRTSNLLNVVERLRHVIEVSVGGIADLLALPVGEAVGEEVGDTALDQWVGGSISKLVPAVGGTDLEARELLLNLLDTAQELLGGKGATVETLGADSDRVNNILVTRDLALEDGEILIERLVIIGPKIGKSRSVS